MTALRSIVLLGACLSLQAAPSFGPVTVTNHAGRALSGELGPVTNGVFTVDGRAYPLSILPAAEQRRVKKQAGADTRSPAELQRAKTADYLVRRTDLREQAGEITPEQAAQLRDDARKSVAASRPLPKTPDTQDPAHEQHDSP